MLHVASKYRNTGLWMEADPVGPARSFAYSGGMSKRSIPDSGKSRQLLADAVTALRRQQPQEAERLASVVLHADPDDVAAAGVLGRALLIQNRAAEAMMPLERAAQRIADPEIETLLALALSATGQAEQALDRLRMAATRRPVYPPAYLEQAGLLARKGRFEEAVAVLESGLALAPGSIEMRMELGFVHLKRNDRKSARAMMRQALDAAPGRPDILAALARMMAMDGEYAEAADCFRRVLEQWPEDAFSRNNLGACLLEMGRREEAEAHLRAAVRSAPQAAGMVLTSLASASHGRFFLKPSDAAKFLEKK